VLLAEDRKIIISFLLLNYRANTDLFTPHTHTTHTQLFYGPLGFCPGLPWWLAQER